MDAGDEGLDRDGDDRRGGKGRGAARRKLPWPMDQIVMIPTLRLQSTSVGTELHADEAWKGVDFQFWQVRGNTASDNDMEDNFVTGERGAPQIIETF
ncbi:MAG TPA: hypothetical protein VFV99_33470, partial [Kofleriaceae bacterium]|nr:hypothetical protein [Kofleriaceae bacterium]